MTFFVFFADPAPKTRKYKLTKKYELLVLGQIRDDLGN